MDPNIETDLKVKDLIKFLKKCDPDASVMVGYANKKGVESWGSVANVSYMEPDENIEGLVSLFGGYF